MFKASEQYRTIEQMCLYAHSITLNVTDKHVFSFTVETKTYSL